MAYRSSPGPSANNPPAIGQIMWLPVKEKVQAEATESCEIPEHPELYDHPVVVISKVSDGNVRCLLVRYDYRTPRGKGGKGLVEMTT